jgi:serine/threonine-protein kinase HipA
MISERPELYVWMHLPGHAAPVVCGRFMRGHGAGSAPVGEFVYGQSYLQRSDALPIDPITLPLKALRFTTTHLAGWFSALLDAGPDAWGQRLIDRLHGPQDTFGHLLLASGQTVGALGFSLDPQVPPGRTAPAHSTGSLARLLGLHQAIETGQSLTPEDQALLLQGTSAGGARPKTTVEHEGALWLAKFPSTQDRPDQPPVPVMEAALLSVGAQCALRVPRHQLVWVGDAPVLLVERFDRTPRPEGGHGRWRYASARTLLWSRPEVQQFSYMGSYNALAHCMRLWERTPQEHIRELYRRIAFNCLVGNTDDHDRNTGFVAGPDGHFALSPLFDLSAQPHTPRMHLAMGSGAAGSAVTLGNLLSEPQQFGYSSAEARELIHAQWATIRAGLIPALVALGCAESQASASLAAMPGKVLLG